MTSRRDSEFDAFCARAAAAAAAATAGLATGEPESLEVSYRRAVRFVFSLLVPLLLESRGIDQAGEACRALREVAAGGESWRSARSCLAALGRSTHLDILRPAGRPVLPAKYAQLALRTLLASDQELSLGPVYFGAIPSAWLSMLYERLLDLRPRSVLTPPGMALVSDSRGRKRSGAFFTPPYIVDFIVSEALSRIEDPTLARVLDPAMGAGDFLLRSLAFLSERGRARPEIAEDCLFGCDIDPIAVNIARFLVWLEAGGRADARAIARHLVCADALASDRGFRWQHAFPDAFQLIPAGPGFDAVVGNPPYVAAKNGALGHYRDTGGVRGQSDYYLLFLESLIGSRLVRPGGSLAIVLPDPFLVRANAAHVRRALFSDWTVEGIVHITGAFPSAQVANIVIVWTNRKHGDEEFPVVRLDTAALRRRFELNPRATIARVARRVSPTFVLAQPKAEVLYLVDDEAWRRTFERIHGPEKSLARVVPPFVSLGDLEVEVIFRGEEIGKDAIVASEGDLPILLGGQSVHRYRIVWEGRRINREAVSKPMEWYSGQTILLQKSSARLVAAFDPVGFVIPQSIYGIRLRTGRYDPMYLLALLNSSFLSDYAFRAFTGYKLVQPQLEIEDIRRLPIRAMPFTLAPADRAHLAAEGCQVFERELSGTPGQFPQLAALAQQWLDSGQSDAFHNLLAYLARFALQLKQEEDRGALSRRVDRAIDIVVNRLYGWAG